MADPRLSDAAVAWELEAIARWKPAVPANLPRLSDDERAQVHDLIDRFAAEREVRTDAHRERLARTARHLGRQVGAHLVVLPDAERRLESLTRMHDPETPVPLSFVEYREATTVTATAFAAGLTEGSS